MEIRIGTDNPEDRPKVHGRRSVLAVLSGLGLIGFCLIMIGGTIAAYFDPPNRPPAIAILTPVSLLLAYFAFQQYRLLFCAPQEKARAKTGCFFVLGGLMAFCGIVCIKGVLSESKPPDNLTQWLFRFGGILLGGLLILVIGYLNVLTQKKTLREWSEGQNVDELEKINVDNARKFWRKDILAILSMIAVVGIISLVIVRIEIPETGTHLAYKEFPFQELFPASGEDFSYVRGYRGTLCCDFSIDEQGFRDWISSQGRWEYCRDLKSDDWVWITWSENAPEFGHGISEGLYAGYGNGKGGRAVFDRKTNRVYYWTYY